MKVRFYSTEENRELRVAVIAACVGERWAFCRHRDRTTWEIPGGHREPDEPIDQTAVRELYEETGAVGSVYGRCVSTAWIRKTAEPKPAGCYILPGWKGLRSCRRIPKWRNGCFPSRHRENGPIRIFSPCCSNRRRGSAGKRINEKKADKPHSIPVCAGTGIYGRTTRPLIKAALEIGKNGWSLHSASIDVLSVKKFPSDYHLSGGNLYFTWPGLLGHLS